MNPDLERRLRRFGATVDRAAEAAQQRGEAADPGDLENAVSVRSRRVTARVIATVAASAAALVGVVMFAARGGTDGGGADPASSGDGPAIVVESADVTASSAPPTEVTGPSTEPAGSNSPPTTAVASSTVAATTPTSVAPTRAPQTTRSPVCPDYRPNSTPPLRLCDQSEAVRQVQLALGVNADGYFGPATRAAVEQFQRDHALEVDGLVGSATWAALFPGSTTTTTA